MNSPATTQKNESRYAWLLWFFAAFTGYATFLFVPQVFNDGDSYLHLAVGNWILAHHAVPHVDPFSYTRAGAPFVAHEWLSEIVMAKVFVLYGWNGVTILFGLTTAIAFGMLAWHLTRWLDPLATFTTLFLVAACTSPTLLARPHILVLPVVELWCAGLFIARSQNKAPSFFLLPLMTLWVNMHGSFLSGMALIAPLGLEALIEPGANRLKVIISWGLFSVGALAAALISPYGLDGVLFPLWLMNLKELHMISEWQSVNFKDTEPVELVLIAVFYVCLTRGVKLPALRVLLLIGLLHLALKHARFEMQMSIVGALALAEPLAQSFGQAKPSPESWKIRFSTGCVAAVLVVGVALTAIRVAYPIPIRMERALTAPVAALDHIPENLRDKHMFNEDAFGSYMIYRGFHPYLDGRMDIYGDEFMENYLLLMLPDRKHLEAEFNKYDMRWSIVATGTPIVALMDMLSDWHRIYSDKIAIVYVRDDKQ